MELSLRFKTLGRAGNLMYQAGKDSSDFAILEVNEMWLFGIVPWGAMG